VRILHQEWKGREGVSAARFLPLVRHRKTPSEEDGVLLCAELASGGDPFLAIPPISQRARNGWGTEAMGTATANRLKNHARIEADLLLCFGKCQRGGVDAVAQAGGARAVGENVAEMTAATGACDLNASHAEACVLMLHHCF
jgi:hypothetical protein